MPGPTRKTSRTGNPKTRRRPRQRRLKGRRLRSQLPESGRFLASAPASLKAQLGAVVGLETFRGEIGELTLAQYQRLVDQALLLFDQVYAHLPLKRAMHAVDPVQRLRLLKHRLANLRPADKPREMDFHREMTEIFNSVRDLHTNYLLPAPFAAHTAFLPFQVESFFDAGVRRYLVTRLIAGFSHATFAPGVEVTRWNGMSIERAVRSNADRQAGSNVDARFARGLDALTIRPLIRSLPPDEDWVVIGYRTDDGRDLEIKLEWMVFSPDSDADDEALGQARSAEIGLDLLTNAVGRAKKAMFAPKVAAAQERLAAAGSEARMFRSRSGDLTTSMPNVFRANPVTTPHGDIGYIRIFTFSTADPAGFVDEFVRLTDQLPRNGLIIDVRGNGGGNITAGERLLQVLTPRTIEPEPVQFVNTPLTLELVRRNGSQSQVDLSRWLESIAQATETGATYSRGFPITDPEDANDRGQSYFGPVVLITDALCYSTTDIFAAGFQDHEIGPILGTSGNTGAGGANVWTHELLRFLLPGPSSPFETLPNGAGLRVSVRRTLRVGGRSGTPLEDLGVMPNAVHEMTRDDLLHSNRDLITEAARLIKDLRSHQLDADVVLESDATLTMTATTSNLSRLDVFVDGRPEASVDITDGANPAVRLTPTSPSPGEVELRGYDGARLAAVLRLVF